MSASVPSTSPAAVVEVLQELMSPAGRANPYPLYARLHALGPSVASPDGAVVVVGHAACTALLKDHRLTKEPGLALAAAGYPSWQSRPSLRMMFASLLMMNPPEHTRLRAVVSGAFTPRRVAALRAAVERIVSDLCDDLEEGFGADRGQESDFVTAFAFPLPVTVIGELLGVPPADRPQFRTLVQDWAAVLELLSPVAVDAADAAAVTIAAYLDDLAEARRRDPRDDLVSALVGAQADGELALDDLVRLLALLLAAGFETTTGLLTNGLLALLANPDQADWLRAHPDAAPTAVEELLRFDSPVQMLFGRRATEPLDRPGVHLEPGQRVVTVLGAANRDPAVFEAPDELRLNRRDAPHVSFGGGVHYCLGAPLARLEAEVAFPALMTRFPDLEVVGQPVPRSGIALHGHTSVLVRRRDAGFGIK